MSTTKSTTEIPQLVVVILDQRESNYMHDENPDEPGQKAYISCSTGRKLKSRCMLKYIDEKDNDTPKLRAIRYIQGCDTIFVDEQEAQGFKPNPQTDFVWFKGDRMIVSREGLNVSLYDYLKNYDGNINNKNRPDGAQDVFYEVSTELDAKADEVELDKMYEAMTFMQSLKKQDKGTYTYSENIMEFLCSLFRIEAFPTGFKSEAWVALNDKAQENPALFMSTIAGKRALYAADVNQAIAKGIIVMEQDKAIFTDSKKFIMRLSASANEMERTEALIDYMTNPKNIQSYDLVRTLLMSYKGAATGIVQ